MFTSCLIISCIIKKGFYEMFASLLRGTNIAIKYQKYILINLFLQHFNYICTFFVIIILLKLNKQQI